MNELPPPQYIILIKEENEELHPLFIGTREECKSIMFDVVRPHPSELIMNVKDLDSDFGWHYTYEKLKGGKMVKMEIACYNLPGKTVDEAASCIY